MRSEEVELRAECQADPVQRALAHGRQAGQCLFELSRTTREHRGEQATLGVEIVKEQLLAHSRPPRDLLDSSSVEAATRELLASRCDDPQCTGITELRLHVMIPQPAG